MASDFSYSVDDVIVTLAVPDLAATTRRVQSSPDLDPNMAILANDLIPVR